jgi:hypothetical protein
MELRRPGLITRLGAPFRGMGQRFILISLVIAGFGFMLLSKSDAVFVDRLRTAIADAATPALEVATHPVEAFNRGLENIRRATASSPPGSLPTGGGHSSKASWSMPGSETVPPKARPRSP